MTTKQQIFTHIYNSINPEFFETHEEMKDKDYFFEEIEKSYKGTEDNVLLDKLSSFKKYSELARFLDRFFVWDDTKLNMSAIHFLFIKHRESPIINFENIKINKLPILIYDY